MCAEGSGISHVGWGSHDDLLRSEARYRALVEQVPGIVYIHTNEADPAPMYVSPQVLELTGYTVEDSMADRGLWLRGYLPEDRERVRDEWLSAVGRRAPFSVEYRLSTATAESRGSATPRASCALKTRSRCSGKD